jgi:uncharacterized membrane protein YcaP (DUF421 family)
VIVSAVIFLVVVGMLRILGQEALAKMSGFDVVATVMVGSIVGNLVVGEHNAILDAVAALATVFILQQLIRYLQSRFLGAHHAVREPPRVLVWDGALLEDRLRESSVSADEVRAAIRKAGHTSLSQIRVVVLENDGDWSVVPKSAEPGDESAFFGLPIPGRPENSPGDQGAKATPAAKHRLP